MYYTCIEYKIILSYYHHHSRYYDGVLCASVIIPPDQVLTYYTSAVPLFDTLVEVDHCTLLLYDTMVPIQLSLTP